VNFIFFYQANDTGDQKVSVCLMITVQKEVNRDFLITLYKGLTQTSTLPAPVLGTGLPYYS